MATYYRWKKYLIEKEYNTRFSYGTFTRLSSFTDQNTKLFYSSTIEVIDEDLIQLSGDVKSVSIPAIPGGGHLSDLGIPEGNYFFSYSDGPVRVIRNQTLLSGAVYCNTAGVRCYWETATGSSGTRHSMCMSVYTGTTIIYGIQAELVPGEFVSYVYSTNSGNYPNDGVQDGYYYGNRTAISSPTAPKNLRHPNPIITPKVLVSWDAATSNVPGYSVSKYEVSYATNGGNNWTVFGTTASTSLSVDLPTGITSVQFRIRAQDSNKQWSNYTTGAVVSVLLYPTLSVPSQAMQGQRISVNWTAVTGTTGYVLQRKADTDGDWVEVYSGTDLTFTEEVGAWTSVQYRIQATFGSTPGGWSDPVTIPVVSASALVISGQNGDLGTITENIPYTVSSDTGKPITLERYVNGSLVARLTVESGFAYSIPVMDLPTGAGTIKLVCTVTPASGGPVTATRIWGYTKTVVQFPEEGGPAVLQQDGKKVLPITLAECIKVPVNWGGSLDKSLELLLPLLNTAVMATGSYTGTGTFGQDNPNELTFTFDPEIVIVSGASGSITISNKEPSGGQSDGYIQNQKSTWYSTSAAKQLNVQGEQYSYWAVGKAVQT